ncbi:MAG: hypothetical protein N4A45_11215 [Flavobacteriales bacterium]|jgi:hypothetical protein|nr:hypothetical protein [Flavobacteriales bacterium]
MKRVLYIIVLLYSFQIQAQKYELNTSLGVLSYTSEKNELENTILVNEKYLSSEMFYEIRRYKNKKYWSFNLIHFFGRNQRIMRIHELGQTRSYLSRGLHHNFGFKIFRGRSFEVPNTRFSMSHGLGIAYRFEHIQKNEQTEIYLDKDKNIEYIQRITEEFPDSPQFHKFQIIYRFTCFYQLNKSFRSFLSMENDWSFLVTRAEGYGQRIDQDFKYNKFKQIHWVLKENRTSSNFNFFRLSIGISYTFK